MIASPTSYPQIIYPMEADAKVPPTPVCIPSYTIPQRYPHSGSSVARRCRYDDGGGEATRRKSGRLQVAKEQKEEEENGENVRRNTRQTSSPAKTERDGRTENCSRVGTGSETAKHKTGRGHRRKVTHIAPALQIEDGNTEPNLGPRKLVMETKTVERPESTPPVKRWVIGPLLQSFKSKMASFTEIVMSPVRLFKPSYSSAYSDTNPDLQNLCPATDGHCNTEGDNGHFSEEVGERLHVQRLFQAKNKHECSTDSGLSQAEGLICGGGEVENESGCINHPPSTSAQKLSKRGKGLKKKEDDNIRVVRELLTITNAEARGEGRSDQMRGSGKRTAAPRLLDTDPQEFSTEYDSKGGGSRWKNLKPQKRSITEIPPAIGEEITDSIRKSSLDFKDCASGKSRVLSPGKNRSNSSRKCKSGSCASALLGGSTWSPNHSTFHSATISTETGRKEGDATKFTESDITIEGTRPQCLSKEHHHFGSRKRNLSPGIDMDPMLNKRKCIPVQWKAKCALHRTAVPPEMIKDSQACQESEPGMQIKVGRLRYRTRNHSEAVKGTRKEDGQLRKEGFEKKRDLVRQGEGSHRRKDKPKSSEKSMEEQHKETSSSEIPGSSSLPTRLLRSYSCPEIPSFLLDRPWTSPLLLSTSHSRLRPSPHYHCPSILLPPSSAKRARRHTVCSLEVEREIAPLCLRKEVYPTGRGGLHYNPTSSVSFTSFTDLASCFLSSPLAFLSRKLERSSANGSTSGSSSCSRDVAFSSSDATPSSSSPVASLAHHLFPGSMSCALPRSSQSTTSVSFCSVSSQTPLDGESGGKPQVEEKSCFTPELEASEIQNEKSFSDSDIKDAGRKLGERGKVSRIRIRKTPAKSLANLTPMGLPRPIRLKKKEFSLEEIYTNKNFRKPPEGRLETIFEVPASNRDGSLSLIGLRRLKRLVEFPELGVARKPKKPLAGAGNGASRKAVGSLVFGRTRRGGTANAKEGPSHTLEELDSLLCSKLDQLDAWMAFDQDLLLA